MTTGQWRGPRLRRPDREGYRRCISFAEDALCSQNSRSRAYCDEYVCTTSIFGAYLSLDCSRQHGLHYVDPQYDLSERAGEGISHSSSDSHKKLKLLPITARGYYVANNSMDELPRKRCSYPDKPHERHHPCVQLVCPASASDDVTVTCITRGNENQTIECALPVRDPRRAVFQDRRIGEGPSHALLKVHVPYSPCHPSRVALTGHETRSSSVCTEWCR